MLSNVDNCCSVTPLTVPDLTVDELSATRQSLESAGCWVLTHRCYVYSLSTDATVSWLTSPKNFAGKLGEQFRQRMLRTLTATADEQSPHQQRRRLLSEMERHLRKHRMVAELTRALRPIGRLRCGDPTDCAESLVALTKAGNTQLAAVAQRQLRRMTATTDEAADGNSAPFPLDSELPRESLRREIHDVEADSNKCGFEFARSNNNNGGKTIGNLPSLLVLTDSELYRPYLNDWVPLDVSPAPRWSHSGADVEDEESGQLPTARQRLLASVVKSLSWRQKQLRQQRLAVRLATRSALIGLRQSIAVQPAKNYLELYVNMISRAVEQASLHVRRWSHQLEQSWRGFRELAA